MVSASRFWNCVTSPTAQALYGFGIIGSFAVNQVLALYSNNTSFEFGQHCFSNDTSSGLDCSDLKLRWDVSEWTDFACIWATVLFGAAHAASIIYKHPPNVDLNNGILRKFTSCPVQVLTGTATALSFITDQFFFGGSNQNARLYGAQCEAGDYNSIDCDQVSSIRTSQLVVGYISKLTTAAFGAALAASIYSRKKQEMQPGESQRLVPQGASAT